MEAFSSWLNKDAGRKLNSFLNLVQFFDISRYSTSSVWCRTSRKSSLFVNFISSGSPLPRAVQSGANTDSGRSGPCSALWSSRVLPKKNLLRSCMPNHRVEVASRAALLVPYNGLAGCITYSTLHNTAIVRRKNFSGFRFACLHTCRDSRLWHLRTSGKEKKERYKCKYTLFTIAMTQYNLPLWPLWN